MINKVCFDDEIVVYWNRSGEYVKGYKYKVNYCGNTVFVEKTHFSILDGNREKSFGVEVILVDNDENEIKTIGATQVSYANSKRRIDVTKAPYLAVGDGKTLNTVAIQKAIDDCGVNDCVYVPEGTFLTGALDLRSNTELYVSEKAVLQGTNKVEDYLPKIKSRFEGIEGMCYRSLLNVGELDNKGGYTSQNIVIRGGGAILGGGRELMIDTVEKESGFPFLGDDLIVRTKQCGWNTRGRLLQVCNSENIVVSNVTIGMGASWNLHFIYSKNVVTFGCLILSQNVNNGDGWDVDSCEDCTIFDCTFNTRDDMIAIKSGKNPEGNIINRPTRNVKVFDCRCEHGHGLAVGSEMSGGVEDVCIWDCQMEQSRCGMEIKGAKERGGYVRNVRVYDSSFSIIAVRSVDYNRSEEKALTPPVFENFHFENLTLTGVCVKHTGGTWNESAIILSGFDENGYSLKNVKLKDIVVKHRNDDPKQNISLYSLQGVSIENINCE